MLRKRKKLHADCCQEKNLGHVGGKVVMEECGMERETAAEEGANGSVHGGMGCRGEPSQFWGSEGFLRCVIGPRCGQGTADTTSLWLIPLARGWK